MAIVVTSAAVAATAAKQFVMQCSGADERFSRSIFETILQLQLLAK